MAAKKIDGRFLHPDEIKKAGVLVVTHRHVFSTMKPLQRDETVNPEFMHEGMESVVVTKSRDRYVVRAPLGLFSAEEQ